MLFIISIKSIKNVITVATDICFQWLANQWNNDTVINSKTALPDSVTPITHLNTQQVDQCSTIRIKAFL